MWGTVAEIIVIVWWFGHPFGILLGVYYYFFREWPFPKGYKWSKDLKLIWGAWRGAMAALAKKPDNDGADDDGVYYYSEEDFYDTRQASADQRSRIRHPKNADRAN